MFSQLIARGKRATPMALKRLLKRLCLPTRAAIAVMTDSRLLEQMVWLWNGYIGNQGMFFPGVVEKSPDFTNSLRTYFDSHKEGRGIWKWNHYFEIYNEHFKKFRGREVHILEIGIYSGGSLEMWKEYFGPKCRIYGVDIQGSCKEYEDDSVKVFIGDQEDREFWTALQEGGPIPRYRNR